MSEFKVSICIPVYNVEAYIQRCIESLLSQSLKDIEIIIVNDCTLDASMEIVREYAAKDRRIRIVEHDANHGLMMARRTGYMMAKGDYITFCDSDDSLPADALELLYNETIATGADIVSGTIEYVYIDGSRRRWINQLSYGTNQIAVYKSLLTGEFKHNLCSRLFRRELLQNHPYITYENTTNGEDGMLFYQVIQNAEKIVKIESVVYNYYQNLQSSSHTRLSSKALYSIVQLNVIRLNTCGKINGLQKQTWVYVSKVMNNLIAEGYNYQGILRRYLQNENMEEYIHPVEMLMRYSFKEFVFIIIRRYLKPILR